MSISKMFGMDKDAERDGIIIDYGTFRVKIARAGGNNKRFGTIFQSKMKPHRRQVETDTLAEDVATRVMAEAYAEAVILDMDVKQEDGSYVQGILVEEGETPTPYSKEAVTALLIKYPEFFRDIQSQATQVSLFRSAELDEDTGN